MSKLIEKRIASAASKLSEAYPGLKISLTDLGATHADIRVVAKRGRTAVADFVLDRSFGVRELVTEAEQIIARSFGMGPVPEDDVDDGTAQGRAAEDPEPLLADTPPEDDGGPVIERQGDDEIVGGDPRDGDGGLDLHVDPDFADHLREGIDQSIRQAIESNNRGSLVLNIDVAVRFVDLQTAHVLVFGGEQLSVGALSELAVRAIAEKIGDFASWGYLNSWREPGKHATTVQMRRLQ